MHIAYFSIFWPAPFATAAGVRTNSLLQILESSPFNAEITFFCTQKENEGYQFLKDKFRRSVKPRRIQPNDSHLDEAIHHIAPDVVVFDRFPTMEQFAWRAQKVAPMALRILDTQDFHSLRSSRQLFSASHASISDIANLDICRPCPTEDDEAARELACMHLADLNLIVSDVEQDLLRSCYSIPESKLVYSPFYMKNEDILASQSIPNDELQHQFNRRSNFVSIGNFRHAPNLDSFFWLRDEIWPSLRHRLLSTNTYAKGSEPQLHIYGAFPPSAVSESSNSDSGFICKGPAKEDLSKMFRHYRVSLAPLRFGAGIKGKIADSWRFGVPVTTTSIGSEGMELSNQFGGLVGNTTEEFINGAASLYTDFETWKHSRSTGIEILQSKFDYNKNANELIHRIQDAMANLKERRKKDVIGAVVGRAALTSSMRMSKYLEMKAKNR